MRRLGSQDAFSLDGGGSSTLVARKPGASDRLRAQPPAAAAPNAPFRTASASSRLRLTASGPQGLDGHGLRLLTMSAVAVRPLWMVGAMLVPAR